MGLIKDKVFARSRLIPGGGQPQPTLRLGIFEMASPHAYDAPDLRKVPGYPRG